MVKDKIKLTPAQQKVYNEIASCPGGHLRRHMKGGTLVYRLMDKDFNPIKNLSYPMVEKLIDKELVKQSDSIYILA